MPSVNASSATAVVDYIFKAYDADKDGRLSETEFQTVLGSVLTAVGGAAPGAAPVHPAAGAIATAARGAGFDLSTLGDLQHSPSSAPVTTGALLERASVALGGRADAEALLHQVRQAFVRGGLDIDEVKMMIGDRIRKD